MIPVRASVLVTNPDHPRACEAGVVVGRGVIAKPGANPGDPDTEAEAVIVRFDRDQPDQADEAIDPDDLRLLCEN